MNFQNLATSGGNNMMQAPTAFPKQQFAPYVYPQVPMNPFDAPSAVDMPPARTQVKEQENDLSTARGPSPGMRQCTVCNQHKKINEFPRSFRRASLVCSVCVLLKKTGLDCMPSDMAMATPEYTVEEEEQEEEERTPPSRGPSPTNTNVPRRSSSPTLAKSFMKRISWSPTSASHELINDAYGEDLTPPGSPAGQRKSSSPTIGKSFKKRLSSRRNSTPQAGMVPDAAQELSAPAPVVRRGKLIKKRMSWAPNRSATPPEMVNKSGSSYA